MEMFYLLKFLNWCGKNYCNYNKYFSSHCSVLLWKYFVSGVDIFCLWCENWLSVVQKICFVSGVEIFCSYCRIVIKRKISTPEMKNFHTRKEIFTQFGKLSSMPRTACLLELKELGVSHLSSDPKVVSSSPEPGSIVRSLTDGDSE